MKHRRTDQADTREWEHLVQFYESDQFLFDSVAEFLGDGLLVGDPVVVFSTAAHRDGIIERLAQVGVDWDAARRKRQVRWMDARAALESVMVGRVPDPERFQTHIGDKIRASVGDGNVSRVRAYGELVDLLWREGNVDAAVALEEMWNGLGRSDPFSLLCAYGRGNVYQESRGQKRRRICEQHTAVLPEEPGSPAPEAGAGGAP